MNVRTRNGRLDADRPRTNPQASEHVIVSDGDSAQIPFSLPPIRFTLIDITLHSSFIVPSKPILEWQSLAHEKTHAELESWKTNDLLPEIAQESIQQLLADAVKGMDNLDREILEIKIRLMNPQQHLEGLQHQKTEDTARIRILRIAISPWKKVPLEVLIDIFSHLVSDKMVLPPTKKSHPWTLTHVCAQWRNIVWASPAISGGIQILDVKRLGEYWKQDGFIPRWIHIIRAAFYHVLSMTRSLLSLHAPSDGAAAIFDLLLSHSHRFRSLTLELDKGSFASLMSLPQHSLKYLEDLDINIYGYNTPVQHPTSSLETLPNFRKVSLTSMYYRKITLSLLLPWEQLTEITLTYMDLPPTVIHAALQHCQTVRKCTFTIGPEEVSPSNTVIALPNLEMLDLACHHTLDWDAFLLPFVTPSLKGLRITTHHALLQSFMSLIVRSECSLSTMVFDLCKDEPFNYESFLAHLSTVTTFKSVWTTPTSIVKKIYKSLLPLLKASIWTVYPDGLEYFLDYINAVIQDSTEDTNHRKIKMTITCCGGPGLEQVEKRYQGCYQRYRDHPWLDLEVQNLERGNNMEDVIDSDEEWVSNDGEDDSDEAEDEALLDSGDD